MSENPRVCVTVKLSFEEFLKGTHRNYVNSRMFIGASGVSVILGFIALWKSVHAGGSLNIPLFMIFWPLIALLVLPRLTSATKPNVLNTKQICFTNLGSHHQGDGYNFDRAWPSYNGCLLFDDMVILKYGLGNASIIPKTAFKSKENFDTFLELVCVHLGKNRIKSK